MDAEEERENADFLVWFKAVGTCNNEVVCRFGYVNASLGIVIRNELWWVWTVRCDGEQGYIARSRYAKLAINMRPTFFVRKKTFYRKYSVKFCTWLGDQFSMHKIPVNGQKPQ